MDNQKRITVPVLAIYSKPEMWNAILKTKIAVQAVGASDAEYIAFIRTELRDKNGRRLGGILSHIAKVKNSENDVPSEKYIEKAPELRELFKTMCWPNFLKFYYLDEIKELSKPVPHRKGDSARSRVNFHTTLEEIQNANVLRDIKTLRQLKAGGSIHGPLYK